MFISHFIINHLNVNCCLSRLSGVSSADTSSLAIIYRPPSSSTTAFYDELSDLLTHFRDDIDADRFIACGDVNCPSSMADQDISSDLLSVLDVHGLCQFVSTGTRQDHTDTPSQSLAV